MASQVSRCPELSKQCLCFHIPFLRWSHRLSLARQLYHRTLNSRLYFGVHHRLFGADGVTKPIPQLSLQHPSVRTFVAIVSAAPSVHPSARPRFRRLIAWVPFSGRQPTYQPTQEPSRWTQWRKAVKTRIKARRKWLKLGLQNSIMLSAAEASSTMDENALSWTLTVLDDDREFEDFVARVPGFFESASVPNASTVMLSLMNDQSAQSDQFDPVLGSRIDDLLKTCVPGTSPLTEQLRRNRLRICMRTLWYCAREYNQPGNTNTLPSYVRTVFANPEMTRRFQSEEDLTACLIGRSFSSLIVRKLSQDIGSRADQGPRVKEAELACLAAILGKTSAELVTLLSQPGAIGLANIVSLTSSEMDTVVEGRVPSEVQDIFRMTLDILLADDLLASPNAELPPELVAIFHETYSNAQRLQVPDWLMDRLRQILEALSVVRDDSEPEMTRMAMPEPELGLGSLTNTSNISLPSWLPSREGSAVRDSLLGNVR